MPEEGVDAMPYTERMPDPGIYAPPDYRPQYARTVQEQPDPVQEYLNEQQRVSDDALQALKAELEKVLAAEKDVRERIHYASRYAAAVETARIAYANTVKEWPALA